MHAVVTGASAGIGAAIARVLAAQGASVTLVARRRDALESLARELPTKTHVVVADLSDAANATSWLTEAEEALGPTDILVNNAGMQIVSRTQLVDPEHAEKLMRLNVFTPFRLTRAVLPAMLKRDAGTIVDVSSLAGLAPTPGMYHYSASKAALGAASESLRGELRGTGVHVVTVYPGPVATEMAHVALETYGPEHAKTASRLPTGTPEELARLVAKAINKKEPRVVYPAVYNITRLFPGTTRWVMDRATPLPPEND
ncbi:MAG: short-subunit dehydrogenase [Myxococcota bacterium]|jgi:short-subunit dehydrogenase